MKKILLAAVAVLMMAMLTACSETAEDAADTVVGLNDKVSDAETILGDYKETMSNVDATGEGTPNVQTNNTSLDDFVFEFGGVTIAPDMNTKEFLDKLGVEYVYQYEAKDIGRFYDFRIKDGPIIEINRFLLAWRPKVI